MSSEFFKARKDFWEPYDKDINDMEIGETAYGPSSYINFTIDKVLNSIVKRCMPVSEKKNDVNIYSIIKTNNGFYFKRGKKEREFTEYEVKDMFFKEIDKETNRIKDITEKTFENTYKIEKNDEFSLFEAGKEDPVIRISGMMGKIIKSFGDIGGDKRGRFRF